MKRLSRNVIKHKKRENWKKSKWSRLSRFERNVVNLWLGELDSPALVRLNPVSNF